MAGFCSVVSGLGVVSSIGHDLDRFAASLEQGCSGVGYRERADGASGNLKVGAEIKAFSLESTVDRLSLEDQVRARALKAGTRASLGLRTVLAAVLEAWGRAGLSRTPVRAERIAVVVAGSNISQASLFNVHARYAARSAHISPRFALEFFDTNYLGTISEVLGARGPGCTVGGASASGNLALIRGHELLRLGLCDVCVVAGPLLELSILELQALSNAGALCRSFVEEPSKACRPFDKRRAGFVYGEASACVILEQRDGARERPVSGYFWGGAVQLDGSASPAPNMEGESRAMALALEQAGVERAEVDYVNAHGSSSELGDQTELAAIHQVFGAGIERLEINSTKGLTGHCLSAAGVVEVIAVLAQAGSGFIHVNANLDEPVDDRFRFVRERALRRRFRYALSNSFGFGGINSSVVVEAAEA